MPRGSGKGTESIDSTEMTLEQKVDFEKRKVKQDRELKKHFKIVDEWLVIEGKKCLHKSRSKIGSGYSQYVGNTKKKEVQDIIENGGQEIKYRNGRKKFIELREINGRPFTKKE